jgi:hypothetical protein
VTPALTQVSQTIKEQELYILTMRSKAIAAHQTIKEKELFILTM